MFKNNMDLDYAVSFLASEDITFKIKRVNTDGVEIEISEIGPGKFEFKLDKNDIERIIFLFNDVLDYIKEND